MSKSEISVESTSVTLPAKALLQSLTVLRSQFQEASEKQLAIQKRWDAVDLELKLAATNRRGALERLEKALNEMEKFYTGDIFSDIKRTRNYL